MVSAVTINIRIPNHEMKEIVSVLKAMELVDRKTIDGYREIAENN
jgi:hypothetical protein